ncbi:hypothetical protein HZS_5566 [Henneguya salminicola]|nr:hypothetical protein HZS_5566 [Henneguya salminicola]
MKANGECDKSMYCTGQSSHCPINSYKNDYENCNNEKGFCVGGNCMNMHTICMKAYGSSIPLPNIKKDSVFYSPFCSRHIATTMRTLCPRPTHLKLINELICEKNPKICDHFVCETSQGVRIKNTYFFDVGKRRCVLPKEENRIGFLSQAPNYMFCGVDTDGTNNYCWNNNCKNGINGKKCRLGQCRMYMVYTKCVKYRHYFNQKKRMSIILLYI